MNTPQPISPPALTGVRLLSFLFLFLVPFVFSPLVAFRALRIAGLYQVIGIVCFLVTAVAVWCLGKGAIRARESAPRLFGLAGLLLVFPFAIGLLLWIGLGGPWQATTTENEMRYVVLIVMSVCVASGFVVLKEATGEYGERLLATLGFGATLIGGPCYVIWNTFAVGAYMAKNHTGAVPPAIITMMDMLDVLLFIAGFLTYLATAAFALSLARIQWLGHRVAQVFAIISGIAVLFLIVRGMNYPDPKATSSPWYTNPRIIVGIPAVPFIMPALIGVMLLRRAGDTGIEKRVPTS